MKDSPSIGYLVDTVSERMELTWIAGLEGAQRRIAAPDQEGAGENLVGPLNLIHPNRVQLIGQAELNYLESLSPELRRDSVRQLFANGPVAVVLTQNSAAPEDLVEQADESRTPLLVTGVPDHKALENLQYYLSRFLAERITLHGVFLEVLGMGTLLTGEAAVGKSELALELISRGHRLVADDAPEFARIAPDIINGTCPPMLRDFLEVHGLGLLNIRALFGESAIKRDKYLRLIVHLENMEDTEFNNTDRLMGSDSTRDILGIAIPQVTIPIAPGRNMAILIETAVRKHTLRLTGYDAGEDFIERQRSAIKKVSSA